MGVVLLLVATAVVAQDDTLDGGKIMFLPEFAGRVGGHHPPRHSGRVSGQAAHNDGVAMIQTEEYVRLEGSKTASLT